MNAEHLHAVAKAVLADIDETKVVSSLQALTEALRNQANQPTQPTYQQQVSSHLTTLLGSLAQAPSDRLPPSWRQHVAELGASELLGGLLADRVQAVFSRNQITVAVAADEIEQILSRVTQLQTNLAALVAAFTFLHVGSEVLAPGSCELGLLVPREAVDNQLYEFGIELQRLHRVFAVFSELAGDSRLGFSIRSLSSSDLNVALDLSLKVAECVAKGIGMVIETYKKFLEIKKLRSEMQSKDVPEDKFTAIDKHIEETMEKGIDEAVTKLIDTYRPGVPEARTHELRVEIKVALRSIANRIDRGYNIQVRVEPPEQVATDDDGSTSEVNVQVNTIVALTEAMQFKKVGGQPILRLPEPEVDTDKNKLSQKSKTKGAP